MNSVVDISASPFALFESLLIAEGPKYTYIIAEAGVNHNGDMEMAKALIDAAAESGADAVKFQLFDPDALVAKDTPMATYQVENLGGEAPQTQHDLLASLALSFEDFRQLHRYTTDRGLQFLCTPFDEQAALFLHHELKLPLLKIPSGEVTNLPFLKMLGTLHTAMILSTGMSTLGEVKQAVEALRSSNPKLPVALLHCVSAYPAPDSAMNLTAMRTMKDAFPDCPVGFSDHSLGTHLAVAAAALGANIVEKHFTLDKTLPGPDHKASLSVEELKNMVAQIRSVDTALGDGIKQPQSVERDCIEKARKSLVLARDVPAGAVLAPEDVVVKRPGTGISPGLLEAVLGKTVQADLKQDTLLDWRVLAD